MEFVPIFANPNETPFRGLYAVRYEDMPEGENSWSQFIDKLSDAEFRRSFIQARHANLLVKGYFGTYTVSEASNRVLDEFLDITDELADAYQNGIQELILLLNERFKPLDNQVVSEELMRSKAKPMNPKEPWVRLYAVKVSPDLYIFSGGTIKLTQYIDQDEATKHEKAKVDRLRQCLINEGMYDRDAYTELEL
ncbi:MAG: hypothetical protein R2813_13630 [Flavobacteriales bacterium]